MADDIVTRLVAVHGSPRCTDAVNCVVCEAADEIERLREINRILHTECERMQEERRA